MEPTRAPPGEPPRKPLADDFINRLKDVTDIVGVVGNTVNLKQSGSGRYVGLCPFHDEKTPSFSVNASQNFYHCFGCGASGDAIKFVTEQEGVDFYEAIHRLAQLQGMQVEYRVGPSSAKSQLKDEDYQLVQAAANFYHEQLFKHEDAMKYFNGRGITEELIKEYRLGYAPPGYNNLLNQFGEDDGPDSKRANALRLGLIKKNEKGNVYDVFRERVIFPILDMRRRPIGFGGRIINSNNQEAKYINSSESPIFHKQFNVFGLPQALQSKVSKHLVVVEGYMDVLALAGVDRAVASLGTAFSTQHAKILWGRSDKLILAFDGDGAGRKASARAIRECLPVLADDKELALKFMPRGQDPYDLMNNASNREDAWRQTKEVYLEDYLLQPFTGSMDPQAQRLAITDFTALVDQMQPDSLRSKLLVKKLEEILGGIKISITSKQPKEDQQQKSVTGNYSANPAKATNNRYQSRSPQYNPPGSSYQTKSTSKSTTNNLRQMQMSPEQKLILQLMFAPTQSVKLLKKWRDKLEEAGTLSSGKLATQTLDIIKAAQLGSAFLYGYAGGSEFSFVMGGDALDGLRKGAPDACIEKILEDVYEQEIKEAIANQNKPLHAQMTGLIRQLKK